MCVRMHGHGRVRQQYDLDENDGNIAVVLKIEQLVVSGVVMIIIINVWVRL